MDQLHVSSEEAPKGYLSQEQKERFSLIAGVLGALFFFAQFVLPFLIMVVSMPIMLFSQDSWMKIAKSKRGTYWEGSIWYAEQSIAFGPSSKGYSMLKRLKTDAESKPESIGGLFTENPWLLPGVGKLWIISSSTIGVYQDGDIILLSDDKELGDISRPFLYRGLPALVEERPTGLTLMVFDEGKWQEEFSFTLFKTEGKICVCDSFQVLWDQKDFHLFLRFGNTLYYRKGFPKEELDDRDAWSPISEVRGSWTAAMSAGDPAVFLCQRETGPNGFTGMKLTHNKWRPFFTYEKIMGCEMGVYAMEEPGRFAMLLQSFPGSVRLVHFSQDGIESEVKHGGGFPFPSGFASIMFVPYVSTMFLPLVLAFILSGLMRRNRVCEHKLVSLSMPFASLTRRALAQLIDFAVIGWPAILGGLFFALPLFDLEEAFLSDFFPGLPILSFMLFGFLWLIICLFGYSFLEGKWGRSPGKWALGIRVVGTDLEACGFGRALVRNLLKFIDGFFNFMVGIMVVALSENWQRVGDMAARTVVIDARKGGQGLGSSRHGEQDFALEK